MLFQQKVQADFIMPLRRRAISIFGMLSQTASVQNKNQPRPLLRLRHNLCKSMAETKKYPNTVPHRRRRATALRLLQQQLEKGVKPTKMKRDGTDKGALPLSDKDRDRIQFQMQVLKERM